MARFRNLDGSGPHPASAVFRWAVLDRIAGRRRNEGPGSPAPFVRADPALKLTDEPLDEPPRRLRADRERRKLPPAALCIPAVGETLTLAPR